MTPKPFVLCFEAHRKDGRVWAVRQGRVWRLTRMVEVQVPTSTVYRGATARQPKAYMYGLGVVSGDDDVIMIEPN